MNTRYCYGCMELMQQGQVACPICGFDHSYRHNEDSFLPEGTVLNRKYLIGKVIGKGGFGITYLGLELSLRVKIAIKEYFPSSICTRSLGSSIVRITPGREEWDGYQKGMLAFQTEAQTLAKFNSPSIVHVREFFQANNTAHIVMDYIGGIGLGDEIERCGGRLPWQRTVNLFLPLMLELDKLHRKNLIHRDIKPGNIKIINDESTGEERLILLDFGAARGFTMETVTYSQILTPGYAPYEQYQEKGHQGPYTDVYALCGTMYKAITGQKPPSAPDRIASHYENLPSFISLGLDVPGAVEKPIAHGLRKEAKDRPQTMIALHDEFEKKFSGISDKEWQSFQKAPVSMVSNDASQTIDTFDVFEAPQSKSSTDKKHKIPLIILPFLFSIIALIMFVLYFISKSNMPGTKKVVKTNEIVTEIVDNSKNTEINILSQPNNQKSTDTSSWSSTISVGDVITFGHYEQDENEGVDPIEWQVLTVENDRALVISRYALEARAYHDTSGDIIWENCTLRKWLNDDFYFKAFYDSERQMIVEVINNNSSNSPYGTISDGGNNTSDRIFLLSIDEIEKYLGNNASRECKPTLHAIENGVWEHIRSDNPKYRENAWWWLRSPGFDYYNAATVDSDGTYTVGNVGTTEGAVRPAFWLRILPADLKEAGGTTKPETMNTTIPASAKTEMVLNAGDMITLGRYEQNENEGVDPIEWQVLTVENDRALVISRYGLEAKAYNDEPIFASWEECSLRQWLNEEFYNSVFNEAEKNQIIEVTNSNPKYYSYGTKDGNSTTDKIFLLSVNEAKQFFKDDEARKCKPTYHAVSNGAYESTSDDNKGNTMWWLRSPGLDSNVITGVWYDGIITFDQGEHADAPHVSVRPVFWLRYTSKMSEAVETPMVEPMLTNTPASVGKKIDLKVGDLITLGRYEQDENVGADSIEWKVLAVNDNRVLLISRYALEAKTYNNSGEDITWEKCTLRKWLNEDFYNTAFNEDEKTKIIEVKNSNPDNPKFDIDGGNDTWDKIFLLTIEETNKYIPALQCKPTYHAYQNGVFYNDVHKPCCWLRSPGSNSKNAAVVYDAVTGHDVGYVYNQGSYVSNYTVAVRPVFWLNP